MAVSTLKRLSNYAGMARDVQRLRSSHNEHVAAQVRKHLIARMGKMRGLPQKLGQMLSLSDGGSLDDDAVAAQYATLQEQAEPLPLDVVRPVMESQWGCQLEDIVREIDPEAHAASLGQVHRAQLHDGREVAVKVQYPGIHEAVMADLKFLGWLSVPVGNLKRGFDLGAYRQTILEDLERELDYCQEARQQNAFASWAEREPWLVVPSVVDELSGRTVLVTEWQEGEHWNSVRTGWSQPLRRELANSLLKFFLQGMFTEGMMQADWHPGNFRFRRMGSHVQLVLYDFGCIYQPTETQQLTLARLIKSTMDRSESPWPLFLKLGFDRECLEPLADKLPALCRTLFEPFCVEYPYDVAKWNLSKRVEDILGNDRWNFRMAGPAALIFLMRAFGGLNYFLAGLESPIFWKRALQPMLVSLAKGMQQLQLEAPQAAHHDYSGLAKHLKIRVQRDGVTKAEVTQYASSIENLETLLDEDVKRRIDEQEIQLGEIVSNVRRRGYAPGPVFELTDATKDIKVWLE